MRSESSSADCLLVFGLQWLRKAILRASGFKALHDEREAYEEELVAARAAGTTSDTALDPYSFTIAFKGVFLEGLEVVFIVLTFGANQHRVGLAAAAAAAAVLVVILAGDRDSRAAGAGAREHDEVRGRRDADLVRDVLGRRGRRRALARRRRRAAGDRPGDGRVRDRDGGSPTDARGRAADRADRTDRACRARQGARPRGARPRGSEAVVRT